MKNDILFECGFYGRWPHSVGCLYDCPKQSQESELLFTALLITKILTHKKISFETARVLQNQLKQKIWLAEPPQNMQRSRDMLGQPIPMIEYKCSYNSSFSASMIIRERPVFRLGYIGFGFFLTNRAKLRFCAEQTVYAFLRTMYHCHKEDEAFMSRFEEVIHKISSLTFGKELDNRNYYKVACNMVKN